MVCNKRKKGRVDELMVLYQAGRVARDLGKEVVQKFACGSEFSEFPVVL